MKALILTSNSPRHKYFTNIICRYYDVCGIISEPKSNYYVNQQEESEAVKNHFIKLLHYEDLFFNQCAFCNTDLLEIDKQQINNEDVVEWSRNKKADIVFLFGTGILKQEWLSIYNKIIINLHLGLSPFYRGSATLFWPFVNDEIECVGATIHLAVEEIDAGNILGRVKPDLEVGDNYYTITFKTIKEAINQVPILAMKYIKGEIMPYTQNLNIGKVYKKKDFNEQVLNKALNNIGVGLTAEKIQIIKRSNKCNCL